MNKRKRVAIAKHRKTAKKREERDKARPAVGASRSGTH